MAKISRTLRVSAVALGMALLFLRPGGVVAQERPKITVSVYNRSRMPAPTLKAGELVAQEILRRAEVDSIWVNCPVTSSSDPEPECGKLPGPTRLILTVVPRSAGHGLDPTALGLALQVESGFGSYCYIFQERLDELAAFTRISPAELLGPAMAHEIGHLLKGSNSHSPRGIMSGQWYAKELRAAAMGWLTFTAADVALMRTRLAQTSRLERIVSQTAKLKR